MSVEVASWGDARARVDRIKSHVMAAHADMVDSWRRRDWIALGYADWDALCHAEFAGSRIALSISDRQALTAELSGQGMSTRAIASVVGVSDETARRDAETSPATNVATEVTGLDGKTYQRKKPTASESAAIQAEVERLRAEGRTLRQIGDDLGLSESAVSQRLIRAASAPPTQSTIADQIRALAEAGRTRRQIAAELGIKFTAVQGYCSRNGIDVPGERERGGSKSRSTVDVDAAVARWVDDLEASLDSVDSWFTADLVHPDSAAAWAASLDESAKRIRAISAQIKSNMRRGEA